MKNIKPSGYWTKERCHEEALKYNTISEFQRNSYSACDSAYKKGFMSEICSHMQILKKPSGYWTKEKCAEEALKYNNRSDFNKNCYSAYNRAIKNNWLDDICSHMIIKNNKYKRCIYCYEFSDNHVYIGLTYNLEKRHNDRQSSIIDKVIIHINKTKIEPIRKQLTEYIEVNEAIKMEAYYVNFYKENGWNILNKAKTGAIGGKLKWTKEKCAEEALKYIYKTEFIKKAKGAYASSCKFKWLDEICTHMIKKRPPNFKWSYDECKKESLKYDNKKEFRLNSKAYYAAYKNGWLDEICSHMVKKQKQKV